MSHSDYPCPNCGGYWLSEDSSECVLCGWTDGELSPFFWVAVGSFVTAIIVLAVATVLT